MLCAVGSLVADALLVVVGEAIFPGTKGYVHFRFSDYAKLTVIGVVIAGAAWPVVARLSSAPRWLFSRLAVVVTLLLWLPDLYILYKGQPAQAVAVLMVMHLAIALVTYNLVVRAAPVRGRPRAAGVLVPEAGPLRTRSGGRGREGREAGARRRFEDRSRRARVQLRDLERGAVTGTATVYLAMPRTPPAVTHHS